MTECPGTVGWVITRLGLADDVGDGCDCLIYATGFEIGLEYTDTIGFNLYGRGGQSLSAKWRDGAETLHSMFTRGFRNCFILSTRQSGQSANFQHMLDEKSKHLAFIIREPRLPRRVYARLLQ